MAQLRNALRAYALEDHDPASILRRLDKLTASLAPQDLATAVVAVLDPSSGEVRVASAGHPWPLVRGSDGTYVFEFETHPPLGAGALGTGAPPPSARLLLSSGESVLLVSDGMFERRDESVDVSLGALTEMVDGCLADPASSLDDCLADLMRHAPDSSIDDDVTLLLVRRD
jgi:serine phosphatase RsbU (regulator of sigma subunit)